MTHIDMLEAAIEALGPIRGGCSVGDALTRASAMFPEMTHVRADSASATMDFHTVNVRGRASRPGDFCASDRWDQRPTFIKVARGRWRLLSAEERRGFQVHWARQEPRLMLESFEESDWNALIAPAGRELSRKRADEAR